jgi:glycosyltransferase involved in cell wall biosynthesis
MSDSAKILHLGYRSNAYGGENMLNRIISEAPPHFTSEWLILRNEEQMAHRVRRAGGVAVRALNLEHPFTEREADIIEEAVRQSSPDIIQGWATHGNYYAGRTGAALGIPNIWRLGEARLLPQISDQLQEVVHESAQMSAEVPAAIIAVSQTARDAYISNGYAPERIIVIHNGVDTNIFRPNQAARSRLRESLGISPGTTVLGLAARHHPDKRHVDFIEATRLLLSQGFDVHSIMCGEKVDESNEELTSSIRQTGYPDRFSLLGELEYMQDFYPALDIHIQPSLTEGQSNSLLEASAAGVVSVVTGAGGSNDIIETTGHCVAPRQPAKIADACQSIINQSPEIKAQNQRAIRGLIIAQYALSATASAYYNLYSHVLGLH